jgi:hypothetical protein
VTFLRTLKTLVLGETWLLPVGIVAVVLLTSLVARPLLADAWTDLGGFVLLAGIGVVLAVSVSASGRPRSR